MKSFAVLTCALWLSTQPIARAQDSDAGTLIAPAAEPPPAAEPTPTPTPAPTPALPADSEEILVVGTKLAHTAGSAHVLGAQELEQHEYDDPLRVLSAVPGVYVRGEDGYGLRPNIGLRGANPDRSKKVTLMEDGVLVGPAPYSAPAAYYFPLITRMSEVRVIKGPGSIAYGPQTVGGAVDMRTRPIPDQLAASVDIAGGEYFYQKLDATFGGTFDRVGFLLEGVHIASDGFKHLPDDGETGFYRNEVMAKARYDFSCSHAYSNELQLKLTYSEELSNETYLGLSDADLRADPLQRYGVSKLDRMRNHRTSLVATHTLDLNDAASLVTDVYRHDYFRIWRKVNRFGGADLFDVLSNPDTPRNQIFHSLLAGESDSSTTQETLFIGPNEREFVSQGVQSRLQWDADTGPVAHHTEFGVRLHYDRIDRHHSEDGFLISGGNLIPDELPTLDTALNEAWTFALALYAMDAASWGPFTLTPGVRVEFTRSGLDDRLNDSSDTRNANVLLPGVGAFYAITDDLGVLAGVYRGFSPPPPGANDAIKPELSVNYEAGVRISHAPARLELIGFYNDYQNLTAVCSFSSGCDESELDQQVDAGHARIYGFEAFVEDAPPLGGGFSVPVRVAYTLTRTELLNAFQSDDPIFGNVERGDELPYVPRHQLNATIGLDHPMAGGDITANYVSAMREQPGAEPLSQVLATDKQFVIDVSLYYHVLPFLQLYGEARNLFDAHELVSRRPFGARPNAPRMLELGVKIHS